MSGTVAIIQARVGSQRLPRKVLTDIEGATMLARVVERVRASNRIDEIVIATSDRPGDDAIVDEAAKLGVAVYRGSETDVLSRYVGAAQEHKADAVLRVTADCPLLDADVIDSVVGALVRDVDYTSNTHTRTYPRGLDVEAFHGDTLYRIARMATSPQAREHVTSFVMDAPELFRTRQICAEIDDSVLRWTVDTSADLALVRTLYARFGLAARHVPYRELVAAVRATSGLHKINGHVQQKPLSLNAG